MRNLSMRSERQLALRPDEPDEVGLLERHLENHMGSDPIHWFGASQSTISYSGRGDASTEEVVHSSLGARRTRGRDEFSGGGSNP